MPVTKKIAVQFDFDGTITLEDVSFLLLDTYVGTIWREYWEEYTSGRISVGAFNRWVFGMMKADRRTMTDLVLSSERVKIRPGFREVVDYCRQKGYRVVIVSNGLTFYIQAILEHLGVNGIEVHAAENEFHPGGLAVRYLGPDGNELDAGFKEAYTDLLVKEGYEVIYVGDGRSDLYPARRCRHVFATGQLLEHCRQENLACLPYHDFFDVIRGLEKLDLANQARGPGLSDNGPSPSHPTS
jgi:2-hydroxy-3-keto-5-methylthiopentenyl-1-phosphate phosphatase